MLIIVSSSSSSPECHLSFSTVHFPLDILPKLKFMGISTNSIFKHQKAYLWYNTVSLLKKSLMAPCCLLNYIQGLQYDIQGSIYPQAIFPTFSSSLLLFHTYSIVKTKLRDCCILNSPIFFCFQFFAHFFSWTGILSTSISFCQCAGTLCKALTIGTYSMMFPYAPQRDIIFSF